MMHNEAKHDLDEEHVVYVIYYMDGCLINLWRLQVYSIAQERPKNNLLFMDDAAIVVHTEPSMQRLTSFFCIRLAAEWP